MASQFLSQTHYQSFQSANPSGASSVVMMNNSQSPMYQTVTSNFAVSVPQGGSRIKVAVRIRPLLEHERTQGHECSRLKVQNGNEVV